MLNMGASGLRHPGQGRPACGVFDRRGPSLRSSDGERTVAGTGYDRGGQRATVEETTMETITISLPAPGGCSRRAPPRAAGLVLSVADVGNGRDTLLRQAHQALLPRHPQQIPS